MSFQITPEDPDYPSWLREIHDPPARLWGEGEKSLLSQSVCVAVVGARECSPYGREVAFSLSRDLVMAGVVVVSGLAYGIDTEAHRGALAGGGKTIAVLGCGIDIPYPAENLDLKKKIASNGVLISEYAPGTKAASWTFPRRNRIISGLSRGVVVVEANEKSGSLITARLALQQGREVFAVPGDFRSPLSTGTHRLIQEGAKLVISVKDILDEIGISSHQRHPEEKEEVEDIKVTTPEGKLLTLLSKGPRHMDDLVQDSQMSVEELSSLLVELEISGRINSLPGGRFVKTL